MTPMQRCVSCAALAVAALLTGCGSSGGDVSTAPPSASASGTAVASAATDTPKANAATFSCAIKPGTGLLPSASASPGRQLASIADIENAIGFTVSTSVDVSMVTGYTQCRYSFSNGPSLDLTILDDNAKAQTEFGTTQTRKLSLHDRACNGCTLSSITALSGLGDQAYTAVNDNQATVVGVIAGGTYFEIESLDLKPARLMRLATQIAGNLTNTQPSLPPLPTPT